MKKEERISQDLLKVGEIAKISGVSASTIKYYTELGLIKPTSFTKGGYRLYSGQETLIRVQIIKSANNRRLSLTEIKEELTK